MEKPATSFGQERLWFLHQLEPASGVYNAVQALHLQGKLDLQALSAALDGLIARHETLRTSFRNEEGIPAPIRAEKWSLQIGLTDLRSQGLAVKGEALEAFVKQDACRPFDLSRDLMLRASLLRYSDVDHVLILTMHHIASDAWSRGILFHELAELYRAHVDGATPHLPPLPVTYATYARRQRDAMYGAAFDKQLAYWKEQFRTLPPPVEIPADFPRPPRVDHTGLEESAYLPAGLCESLRRFAAGERATIFMVLLATFQLLLQRLSGGDQIAIGVPVAGRTLREYQELIGFFVNTLVLRADLSGNPTFRELLGRVRTTVLNGIDHQEFPFEKLVEELGVERSLARNPLFDVMLNFDNLPQVRPELPGLSVTRLDVKEHFAKFALTLYVAPDERGMRLRVVYQKALYSAQRMRCLLEQYRYLLEQVINDPAQPIDAYSIVSTESGRVLPDPGAALSEPPQTPVPLLFGQIAARTPEAPAVIQSGREWSYSQLQAAADRLARNLRGAGLQNGDVVAISGDRSFGMIAAMMGVLAAGGVILPIDAELPEQRKRLLAREARARYHLHVSRRAAAGAGPEESTVVMVDPGTASTSLAASSRELPIISPDSPAYIFFTSGTSGVPKAVLGCHKGLSHFVSWQRDTFGIGAADRVSQLTALSFDVILRDVFLPLVSGGAVCVPVEPDDREPENVLGWLEREGVTALHLVPTLGRLWLECHAGEMQLPKLRWVFFSGEPLTGELVERWRRIAPGAEYVNLYGPTETTMVKMWFPVPPESVSGVLPVGKPMPQCQALVLSRRRRLCGIGEAGEIGLRTPFRTLGYLNSEEMNSEKFIRNPFRNGDGDVIYLTGDMGRYRPDGLLEIMGRADEQLKVHGVRVEPAEVAAVLNSHPLVSACYVAGWTDESGETALVAYVVAVPGDAREEVLAKYLAGHLPSAMVPNDFVFLDRLPVTANGKVDRKALPVPERKRHDGTGAVPPRTAAEEELARIWSEVLAAPVDDVEANFFAAGGNSLRAVQVIARVRHRSGIDLPLRAMFETPTIAGLAASIAGELASQNGLPGQLASLSPPLAVPEGGTIPPRAPDEPRLLSLAQERLWFLSELESASPLYNIAAAYRLEGQLDSDALEYAFRGVVRRHEVLRTCVRKVDGTPALLLEQEGSFELRRIAVAGEAELDRALAAEVRRPFDLGQDLMIRASLIGLGDCDQVLVVTLHHIAGDERSLRILWHEIDHFYTTRLQGIEPRLPPLPVQYADYALWQRKALEGPSSDRALAYWRGQLAGSPPVLELPADRPRPARQSYQGGREVFYTEPHLTAPLRDFCAREDCTLFMGLLAVFQVLLHRYTGQTDIPVGSAVANRDRLETEALIGFFVNTLVLRTNLEGDPTFREALARVRKVTLGALFHQELPFERLVADLNPARSLSHGPLFQVMLVFFSEAQALRLDGLRITPVLADTGTSKFDLSLHVSDLGDRLRVVMQYDTALFDRETIRRLGGHFQVLLQSVLSDPEQRLSRLPLLTEVERQRLLVEWNNTAREGLSATIHSLFEKQVERTPDAPALFWGREELSYRALNERANRLAHLLREAGAGPDVPVAVSIDRTLAMVVAVLGILKSGGAYVPLDPTYPAERLAFMLEDCGAPAIVTQEHLVSRLRHDGRRVLLLDECGRVTSPASTQNPEPAGDPKNLAYIYYTSGSTGRPKGVAVEHRSVTALLEWAYTMFEAEDLAGVLASTSLSFDLSVFEMFAPLCRGGAIVLAPNVLDLRELPARDKVTLLNTVPSAMAALLEKGRIPPSVRAIIFGGERLEAALVRQVVEKTGIDRIYDCYGPTESTVYALCALRTPDGPVTIGKPIHNTRAYILEPGLAPAPVGVPGELCLAGAGLARGYWRQPELTAARFQPDPHSAQPGDRLYRTGDLARWRADGNIEFLGRLDNQVKMRGFRIELGEIESVLAGHPSIRRVVAGVQADGAGDGKLAAWWEAHPGVTVEVDQLRQFVKEKLPEYMVPSVWMRLDLLPMTANGKVDRKALPAVPSPARERAMDRPRDRLEAELAGIWEDILGVRPVGLEESFFDLGGHSLLAVAVFARIEKEYGRQLPLATLFEAPTVRRLAGALRDQGRQPSWSSLVPIQPAGSRPPLFLVHAAGGHVLFYSALARALGPEQPIYGLQAIGMDGRRAMPARVEDMAGAYIAELRTVQPVGPYRLGGFCAGAYVALEMAGQLQAAGEKASLLASFNTDGNWKLVNSISRGIGYHLGNLSRLEVGRRWEYMISRTRYRMTRIRKGIYRVGRRLWPTPLPLADVEETLREAVRRYEPPKYEGRIVYFQGDGDSFRDPGPFWRDAVGGSVEVRLIPGSGITIFHEPNVQVLARELADCLEVVPKGVPGG